MIKRICCVCKMFLGWKAGGGGITHGYCEPCYRAALAEIERLEPVRGKK